MHKIIAQDGDTDEELGYQMDLTQEECMANNIKIECITRHSLP